MGEGGGEGPKPGPAEVVDKSGTGGPAPEAKPVMPPLTPDAGEPSTDGPRINPFARRETGETTIGPTTDTEDTAGDAEAPADVDRARDVAGEVLDGRVISLKDELKTEGRKATADEKALLLTDYYTHGFPPETYDAFGKKIPVGENGIKITTSEGDVITVRTLSEQTVTDGKATYTCEAVKEGETESFETEVSGADLAKEHMSENVDAVANNFTDSAQRDLMQWHAKGGKDPVPLTDAQLKGVADSLNKQTTTDDEIEDRPASEATQVIRDHVDRLQKEVDDTPEDMRNTKEYLKKKQLLANMKIAEEATGDFGPILRKTVLEEVSSQSKVTQLDVERVLRRDGDFAKQVETAEAELKKLFDDHEELTDRDRKKYESAIKNPSELCDLMMNDKNFAKIGEEITDGLFGHLNEASVNKMYQELLNANQDALDATVMGKIKNMSTARKLSILAILLGAIPAAAVAVAGAVAVGTVGGFGPALGGRR